ncbi:MAG: glycosyltransferase [Clostridium sp.]|uniref:glycosyltransferase n=1 Tax=Clostridium sp. TaxID=1506 RepID=UPI0030437E80
MNNEEIKGIIQNYIEEGKLQEAEETILQYKNIIGSDDEVASMEAIVEIYKGNYSGALECIREGLKSNIFNGDLYFTMGNLYEMHNQYDRAFLCYEQALYNTGHENNRDVILAAKKKLETSFDINVNKCSIVILTYNNLDYTKVCMDSIKKYTSGEECEIIIVDNKSTDGTAEWIKEQQGIKYILNEENKGFPAGCNQGIELAENNNDIFLLNNDTVIMPNSIFNLRMGLYSDEKIGATGAVSNSVSYYQQISETYDDFDGYMDFALKNNIADENSYEQRLKLVGFAMLIKRNVLDKVGLLDERFTPGNFEDDDISLRIVMEGYKLLLCKDTYIHHFGSVSFSKDASKYNKLIATNSKKFEEKWGFRSEEVLNLRYDLLAKIDVSMLNKHMEINVLDIGCGIGATLTKIKEVIPHANIYGVENNKETLSIMNKLNILTNIQNSDDINFGDLVFDIIIVSKKDMRNCINILSNNISVNSQIITQNEVDNQENIQFTGERLVINDFVRENYSDVMLEHLNRYNLASEYVKDRIVIDAASGSGYGSMILSKAGARSVRGFDISEEAVDSAKHNYREYKNVKFEVGDVTRLNVPDSSADVFVSFETIEHIECGDDLISEANRILADEGIFIVSTPNRNATNPGLLSGEKPQNIYHSFEYSPLEFIGKLSSKFDIVKLYGQTVNENIEIIKNKYIRQIFGKEEIDYSRLNNIKDYECKRIEEFKDFEPMYLIAVCRKKKESYVLKNDKFTEKNKLKDYHDREESDISNGCVKFYKLSENSSLGEGFNINNIDAVSIGNNVTIKDGCWLNDCMPNKNKKAKIIINDGCSIGSRFSISVSNECVIGRNVIIGPNVYIADCEHNYKNIGIPIMNQGITSVTNSVNIGENSWVGINATIVGNVNIGKGCVVGANSYVTKDIPDYSVVGGSPAKILKIYDTDTQEWIRVKNQNEVDRVLKNRAEQPLISICIPTFNRAKELDKCLHSIYSQIGNDSLFEIFISNNDSQDNTDEVVRKYQGLYNNITYNKNKNNIGADKNVALVIEKSKGKYIMLHGDDDYFKDNTIYQLMNIINTNTKQSLFFLNVISCDNKIEAFSGINEFLRETSINSGFISSIIIKREDYKVVEEPFKFIDSCFNQIYLQYKILMSSPEFIVIKSSIFYYEGNKPAGYNFGRVFIKNYLDILNYFKEYGLCEENIKNDKQKILQTTILPWYKNIIENKIDIDMDGFEEYFKEYYIGETYFEEIYELIQNIGKAGEN